MHQRSHTRSHYATAFQTVDNETNELSDTVHAVDVCPRVSTAIPPVPL